MAKSKKPPVFEHLFWNRYDEKGTRSDRWDKETATIPDNKRLVYSNEISSAIAATKAKLGDNQPANFAKDFLRKKSRSKNWPKSLVDARWTMKQQTGRDDSNGRARHFLWKPYSGEQTDPFPDEWPIPADYDKHAMQSVTISVASKQIARLDEPRLMQIVAELRIVETHFALYSPLSTDDFKVVHMDHLQMGLKLRGSEIDGLYLADFQDRAGARHPALITVEAKKHDEFVITSQVISQIEHASALGVTSEIIVPIALKHANGGVFVFEYAPFQLPATGILPKDSIDEDALRRVSTVFYEVRPEMVGLSKSAKRPKTAKTSNGFQLTLVETEPDPSITDGDDDDDDDDEDADRE